MRTAKIRCKFFLYIKELYALKKIRKYRNPAMTSTTNDIPNYNKCKRKLPISVQITRTTPKTVRSTSLLLPKQISQACRKANKIKLARSPPPHILRPPCHLRSLPSRLQRDPRSQSQLATPRKIPQRTDNDHWSPFRSLDSILYPLSLC